MPALYDSVRRLHARLDLELALAEPAAEALLVPKMAGAVRPASPVKLPALEGAPVKAIRLRVKDVTTVYVIDDSGSMYPHISGDATGIRYAAAQSLVNLQRASGGGPVHVLHWGTTVPDELIAGPLDAKRDHKRIKQALTIPSTLGGNDLPRALIRAREVTRPTADEQFVYFVISDGVEEVSQLTRDAIAALPADSVHMVLVDRGSHCTPQMEAEWESAGFASLTRLQTFKTSEMAHQLGSIYAAALGLRLPSPTPER